MNNIKIFFNDCQVWKITPGSFNLFELDQSMSAIDRKPKKTGKNSTLVIGGTIAIVAGLLFTYLMIHTTPEENMELVKIIAITESGCIAETLDGFSVNIGDCTGQPGHYVDVPVDQKVKDRAIAMNPP